MRTPTLQEMLFILNGICFIYVLFLLRRTSKDLLEMRRLLTKISSEQNAMHLKNEFDTEVDLTRRLAVLQQAKFSPISRIAKDKQ